MEKISAISVILGEKRLYGSTLIRLHPLTRFLNVSGHLCHFKVAILKTDYILTIKTLQYFEYQQILSFQKIVSITFSV